MLISNQIERCNSNLMVYMPQREPSIAIFALIDKSKCPSALFLSSYFESEPKFLVDLRAKPVGAPAKHPISCQRKVDRSILP